MTNIQDRLVGQGDAASGSDPWYAGLTPRHWRILWGSYMGWIFDGFEAFALVVALPSALRTLLTPEQAQTPAFYAGTAIGITLLGWGIGGLIGGVLCDYIGRKRMMMLAVFFYALFTGLTCFSTSFEMLAVMRFITGLAIGSEWSTGVALVSETWPDKARPKGCGFLHSGFGGGALLASAVWFLLATFQPLGSESWRLIFVAGALPAFCVLYLRRALDESEKWVAAVKAQRAVAASHGESTRPFTLSEIFRDPESRRRVLLTTILSFATTVGWWAVSSWMPAYTEQLAHLHGEPAGVWAPRMSLIYNVGAIIAYVSSGFIADAIGRRPYLLMTFAGSLVMSILTYTWTGDLYTFMVIAFFNGVFTLGFAFSWMAIYLVELFPTAVRATAAGFIFNAARLIAWLFPIIAGALVASLGGLSSAALTMASVFVLGVIVPWFLPETAGKPLPD
ncbi:MFS transporter [Rhodovulum sp. PH10]|uniref:MFS transporter n=1 Tax=Rhodovulum sp. PH10 TaxID=1187851 RepID=UPI000690E4C1|nr:MFS transporter [Rhodovulum sp. PH10]